MTGNSYHNKNQKNAQGKKKSLPSFYGVHIAKHLHFEKIDSTNTWGKQHSDQWAPEGITLMTASEQTAGRGRFKRRWESPSNVNIYATFCFWFDSKRTDIGHIPQLLALAAAQTLEKEGFSPTIKWPNDVLLKEKKVAGILCETISNEELRGIVCGIGLNVNMPLDALKQIDRPATSLFVESGQLFDPFLVLDTLNSFFISFLNEFVEKGFSPFFPLLKEKSTLKKGQRICFHDNQNLIEGSFESLLPDGSVEIRLQNGVSKIYHVGEFIL